MITHITSNSAGVENISDIAGLSKNHPYYAILILFTMLSSAGIPPFIGFHAKLIVIQTLVNQSLVFLSVIVVLMTVISAYYYLRVIKTIYFEERVNLIATYSKNNIILSINVLLLLGLGIFPYLIFDLSQYLTSILSAISI